MALNMQKVFGIGLGKTGTLSLANALKLLGYRAGHYAEALLALQYRSGRLEPRFDAIAHWDALADIPIAATYKTLDQEFPDSKFILTVREQEAWLASSERHSLGLKPEYFENNGLDLFMVNKVL